MAMRDLIHRQGFGGVLGQRAGQEFREPFLTLHHQIQRAFDDLWNNIGTPTAFAEAARMAAIDVRETHDAYEVSVDLPGFDENEIDVQLNNNVLRITAQAHEEHDEQDKETVYSERRQGRVTRAIQLPEDIDPDQVSATYERGVLTVHVNRVEGKVPARRITLKSGVSTQTKSGAGKGHEALQHAAQQSERQRQHGATR